MPRHSQQPGSDDGLALPMSSWADDALVALAPPTQRTDVDLLTALSHRDRAPSTGEDAAYQVPAAISALSMRPRTVQRQVSARAAQRTGQRWWSQVRAMTVPNNHAVRLQKALGEVRAPVSTGRRITVVGAHGGSGGTTLAYCMASIVAAHRGDPVALVDASMAYGGLLTRLPQAPTMSVSAAARKLSRGDTDGRSLMGAGSTPAVLSPGDPDRKTVLLEEIQRHAAVTFVDTERLDVSPADHTVVVAVENTVRGVAAAQSCLRVLTGAGVLRRRVLFAVTSRVSDSGVPTAWLRSELSSEGAAGIFEVPPDRHLAGAAHIHCDLLAGSTYLALAELTGFAVLTSTGGREAVRDER